MPDARLAEAERAVADLPHVVLGRDVTGPRQRQPLETEFDTRLDLVPASLAKGLEFDHVVLLDPEGIVAGEPDRVTGLRRLYVCLTRAVTSLVVLHTGPLPGGAGRMTPRPTAGRSTDAHDVRDALLAAYADPGRGYHDTLHLTEVLDRLDELAAAGEEFDRATRGPGGVVPRRRLRRGARRRGAVGAVGRADASATPRSPGWSG